MNGLLKSRKFWLAVFGCAQAVILHYLAVPDEIWQTIAALVGVVIAGIAVEDHGTNSSAEVYYPADLDEKEE